MGDPLAYNITIPPSPNWYETDIMTYTPDGLLIYGSKWDLIIIKNVALGHRVKVDIIRRAHSQRITSLAINPKWGENGCFLVTTAEDKFIKIWNMDSREICGSHQQHLKSNKIISAAFAGSDRVVSVSDDGLVIVWNFQRKEIIHLTNLFNAKVTITCLSVCPHSPNIAAFGMKNGLISVVDLKGKGSVINNLRGHDKEVISLDWCPIPFNIFPKNPNNGIHILPKQFATARKEDTDAVVREVVNGIVEFVSSEEKLTITSARTTEPDSLCLCRSALTDATKSSDYVQQTPPPKAKNVPHQEIGSTTSEMSTETEIRQQEPSTSTLSADDSQQVKEALDGMKVSDAIDLKQIIAKDSDQKNIAARNASQASVESVPKTSGAAAGKRGKRRRNKKQQVTPQALLSSTQAEAKPGKSSKSHDSAQRQSAEDVKQAQARLEKGLKIDDSRSDLEPAKDGAKVLDQIQPDSVTDSNVPATEDSGAKNEDTGASATEKSEDRKLNQSYCDLESLVTLPRTGSRVFCEACKSEDDCGCVGAVKMVGPHHEMARKDWLLVSSAREPTLIVWRLGTSGSTQTFLRLPSKKQKKRPSDKLWITVKWPVPNKIYCSSLFNELIQWTVPKKGDAESMKVIHNDHSALLFSIATSLEDYVNKDWKLPPEHVVWTTSQDRQLICYKIDGTANEIEKLATYPTLAGAPECLAGNRLNPYRVAIGTGGGVLKIWDLTHSTSRLVTMQNYTQKIHSRVTTAAWHPQNEHIIAFGTQEGRVGFIDVNGKSGVPTLMPHFFAKEIYKIQWAPVKEEVFLYIVAEGKLVYWNTDAPNIEPVVVGTPEGQFVYNFAWKLDYSCLLISFKSGLLSTYSPELVEIDSLMCSKTLHLLQWNPLSHTSNVSEQTFCLMFAAVLNGKSMIVMDHGKRTQDFKEKVVGTYNPFKDQINTISWNNYGTRLAIGTDSGFIFVWDLPTKAVVWNYVHETFQPIISLMYSPFGTEHIFYGTKDCTLKLFRQRDYQALDANTLAAKRSLIAIIKEDEGKKSKDDALRRVGGEDKTQIEKKKKTTELLPAFHRTRMSANEYLSDLRRLLAYVTENCEGDETSDAANNDVDILDIFGCEEAMLALVARNELTMKEKGNGLDLPLAMFRSDAPSFLTEAVRERRVTPAVISLAPLVSHQLWLQAIEIYADIINEDPNADPIEGATYYLACNKIHEAIDLLCERHMFKEALALAKCRLPSGSAIVPTVIEQWGKFALQHGNFERAAECFIYLGRFADAATALFKRTEPQILLFCAELAERVGNTALHRAALYRYQSYSDQSEQKRPPLQMDTIAEVLMDARQTDGDKAGPSSVDNGAGAPPSLIVAAESLDGLAASASDSSLLSSSGSETFITRGEHDLTGNVVPSEEHIDVEGDTILQAMQSMVIQEAEEGLMCSDESSMVYSLHSWASDSTTSLMSQPPDKP